MCKCTNTVQLFAVSILQEGLYLRLLGAGAGVSPKGSCLVGSRWGRLRHLGGRLMALGSHCLWDSLEVEFGTFDRFPCQMPPSWCWSFRIMLMRDTLFFSVFFFLS